MRLLLVLCLSLLAPAPAAAARAADLAPPSAEAAAVSPAGRSVAFVAGAGRRSLVVVKDAASRRAVLQAELGVAGVRRLQWLGEGHLLVLARPPGRPARAFVLDVAERRLVRLLARGPSPVTVLEGLPVARTAEGRPRAYLQASVAGQEAIALMEVAVQPVSVRLAAPARPGARGWVVDLEGRPVAQALYDRRARRWTLRLRVGGAWREAEAVTARPGAVRLLGLARDGRAVLYAVRGEGGWTWREARLDGASPGAPLPVGEAEPILDPQDGRVIGHLSAGPGGEPRHVFFDPADEAAWRAAAGAFPGARPRLASWSADRRRIVLLAQPPGDEAGFAQVDLSARTAAWLEPDHRPRAAGRARPPARPEPAG